MCLGHATIDTILRVPAVKLPPAKVLASACVTTAGGMATNAAAAAARLGAHVALLSRIGDDSAGTLYQTHLASEANLQLQHVQIVREAHTSVSSILVDAAGERLVVPFNDARLGRVNAEAVIDAALREIGTPSACLVDVRWPEGAETLLSNLSDRGCALRVLDADVASCTILQRLAPLSTHIIFSQAGLEIYTACEGARPVSVLDQLLRARRELPTATLVGVTLGAWGFLWYEGEDLPVQHAPTPDIDAIDTLAAGDVFHAAFTVGLTDGMDACRAARFACAAAALKCTRFGGRLGSPIRQEVEDFLEHASFSRLAGRGVGWPPFFTSTAA